MAFLHRLQQGGLRFWRRAVDFVGQKQVREDRPVDKAEFPMARLPVIVNDFRPGDVGRHQVGCELNAAEFERQALGQRLHQQGLRQARNALEDAVPAGKNAGHEFVDHVVLADDDRMDLLADAGSARRGASPEPPGREEFRADSSHPPAAITLVNRQKFVREAAK